ncbi:MAG: aminomethyltransferase [Candidatus Poribacteria bacterium]|nr:MAG: aminomethyltransferase [Candidatus Poribacteria bacterium]
MDSEASSPLRKTPLVEEHRRLGARMVPFAGWEMPLQYEGIFAEHRAVRERVGIFDVSHMGRLEVLGLDACAVLQRLVTNDVSALSDGEALYTVMCREDGGILDDLIVYCIHPERYLLIVNAATREKDVAWIRQHLWGDTSLCDRTEETILLAVQGPRSREVLEPLLSRRLAPAKPFHFASDEIAGIPVIVSRTGYTGELGYEVLGPAEQAIPLWRTLLKAVQEAEGLPAGLGARDTLRLEARLLLYGQDMDETTTPLEAGLSWTLAFGTGFIGEEALRRQKEQGVRRRLVGFQMESRAVARHGHPVYVGEQEIGMVTSGGPSPTLGVNIGLAYVQRRFAEVGRPIEIEIRRRRHPARIVRTPFYRGSFR